MADWDRRVRWPNSEILRWRCSVAGARRLSPGSTASGNYPAIAFTREIVSVNAPNGRRNQRLVPVDFDQEARRCTVRTRPAHEAPNLSWNYNAVFLNLW